MEPSSVSLADAFTESFSWGTITWLVSGQLGNSETMTFGRVVIRCRRSNARHIHANCDEILHLLEGELEHTAGSGRVFHMKPGDTIVLPAGTPHSARSVGERDAVMVVAYSSAYRQLEDENGRRR